MRKRKRGRIGIDDRMKNLGDFDESTRKIKVNVKRHHGDRSELASTIEHELMHKRHPQMTEKEVYRRTAKTKLPLKEKKRVLSLLPRNKIRSAAHKVMGGRY